MLLVLYLGDLAEKKRRDILFQLQKDTGGTGMHLKNKMVFILFCIMLFSIFAYFVIFRLIILQSFLELDAQNAERNIHRAVAAYEREVNHLDRFTHDWSSWDDTYQYAQTGNPKYIEANLNLDTFKDQKLNLIHIYNEKGRLMYGKTIDLATEKELPFDPTKELSPANYQLIIKGSGGRSVGGIILTSYGPMIISANPILTSTNKGPRHGTMIMGRFLSKELVSLLAEQVSVDLHAWALDDPSLPESKKSIIQFLNDRKRQVKLEEVSADKINAYRVINDVGGNPAILLQATSPREIMQKGRWAYTLGMLFIIGAGIIMLSAASSAMRFMVLEPISRLTKNILAVSGPEGSAQAFDTDRKDEIGTLSREFSQMIDRLVEREKNLRQNIENLKLAEEALLESRTRLADIIDFLPDATFAVDLEGKILAWNHAIEGMTGIPKSEIIGKGDYAYAVPFYGVPRPALVDLLFENTQTIADQYDFIRKEEERLVTETFAPGMYQGRGGYIWAIAAPLYDSSGNLAGAIESIRDITESKKAEDLLRLHSETIQQALDGIIVADLDGNIKYMNPAWAEMHGYTIDELKGVNIKVFHTEDQWNDEVMPFNSQALIQGNLRGTLNHVKKDGTVFSTRMLGFMLKDAKGSPVSVIGIARDITEELRLESQLRQSHKMEMVGQLAGGVAHDLNNMLSPILGYTELLLADMFPVDPKFDDLMQIKAAAEKARNLTHELLAFSRKQVLEMKVVDLAELVASYGKMLRRTIREDIGIQIRGALSRGAVKVDVGQMGQVLLNLAVNAQDAMPQGGTITIETTDVVINASAPSHEGIAPGEYVMLSCSDTGIGIDTRILDNIFEPFFTTKDRGKGTGLGLATVYGIVRQHGGQITVSSEPGKGSIFRVFLPMVQEVPEPLLSTAPVKKGKRGSETIVVAEDDEGVRVLTTDILQKHGYNVITSGNSGELIRILEQKGEPVHLLLTDVIMPEMNGMDLYKQLHGMFPAMKVIFMSGYTDDVIGQHGILEKGVHFIQKPFTISTLTSRIREVLDT
jgi:two-component system, cell cycle sensor histidine kinase and response regulator CckA